MSNQEQVQLVVIDDSVRFAFHIWRYLGQSIGIGSGDESLERKFWSSPSAGSASEPCPMRTPDGRSAVWWVPGDSFLGDKLTAVLDRLGTQPWFFLIDMRGQPAGLSRPATGSEGKGLDLGSDGQKLGETAVGILLKRFQASFDLDRVMMVSSYETGVLSLDSLPPLRIWPKSPDTLARLEKRMFFPSSPASSDEAQSTSSQELKRLLHILVTGAGFEIRSDATGGFGLPSTGALLSEMGSPFGKEGLEDELKFKEIWKKLPYLDFKDPVESQNFQKICDSNDLDGWWNYLLERELQNRINRTSDSKSRGEMKMLASVRERDLREAFRRIILKYDWGHLNHTLEAARQGWHTWLTTNYTRFADRAIALVEAREGKNGRGDWQIVSTSIEALSLSREILHGGSRSSDDVSKSRYLFKLHGDVAHLQTMATAGQDKEFFSSLSLPVDSLHQVYFAAETLLEHSLRKQDKIHLVWHIVGHDLEDSLLLGLIARVCRAYASPDSTDFIVVKRKPPVTCDRLRAFLLKEETSSGFVSRVVDYPATAEDYLARIARTGGLPETFEEDSAQNWLRDLGETPAGRASWWSPP
jgi:hypothetical protein